MREDGPGASPENLLVGFSARLVSRRQALTRGRQSVRKTIGLRSGEANRESRPATGCRLHLDGPAHTLGQLFDDREAEAGSDRAVRAVAGVEVEALEGPGQIFLAQTWARVLDEQQPRVGGYAND